MTFAEFYASKRGRDPFPWMVRLAQRFAADDLPDVIDLPTGCGKTEIIVIWDWAQRHFGHVPRRLWMASDRRVIADQTYVVAKALGEDVLASRLRGGIVLDDEPMLDPVRPQVISSTVDQLGSRLLFRAYGSSPRSWPVWAGLAGNSSLIVLDEAHLSPTAEDTMRACQAMGADIRIISMTATPRVRDLQVFGLTDEDRNHQVLRQRLAARRIVELRQGENPDRAAQELLDDGCQRVAVICNTVREARRTFEAIPHPDKYLIIGRQRPLDREGIMQELLPRVASGAAGSSPLVVVATQCVEAGADLDFDGMVSEACPIDALRQRLGRLDRLGRAGESRCILVAPTPLGEVAPYGAAPRDAWRWLSKNATRGKIDLGHASWSSLATSVPDEARSSRPEPISFLEPHLRMLTRTSPRPRVEPDIDLLLHGPGRMSGDVSVVWRKDVLVDDPEPSGEILRLLPPTAQEACSVPLWELKAWLAGQELHVDTGDIEGAAVVPAVDSTVSGQLRLLRWDSGDGIASRVMANQLRPGDVIVLPFQAGGYDRFGWAPQSVEPVPDLAETAYFRRTGRVVQRFDDPEADVLGDRVHRWSRGTIVETFTDEKRSRRVPREVLLEQHSVAVAERAANYARAVGLDPDLLHQAGLNHDVGKAHTGWQLQIKGGDLKRLGEPPLAKGNMVRTPLARLPSGWRHEAESLRLLPEETDDLVRWLVATHHGHARPFWPLAEHGLGLAELMERLQARHGYWRLALLEAVLRCADRAVSQQEMADD